MTMNVFYLDDEEEICEAFCDTFSSDEFNIITFIDYKKMIEEAKKNPPTLIFIDYRLPFLNGDEVAILMDPHIPKILITGEISITTKYKFIKILSKPFVKKEIQSILDQYKLPGN